MSPLRPWADNTSCTVPSLCWEETLSSLGLCILKWIAQTSFRNAFTGMKFQTILSPHLPVDQKYVILTLPPNPNLNGSITEKRRPFCHCSSKQRVAHRCHRLRRNRPRATPTPLGWTQAKRHWCCKGKGGQTSLPEIKTWVIHRRWNPKKQQQNNNKKNTKIEK